MAGLRDSQRGATGRLFCPQATGQGHCILDIPREAEFEQDGRKESPQPRNCKDPFSVKGFMTESKSN